ncbi:MAG TPA: c-type cytochrome, partial [Rhodospirillales bacterium]|nr:c-type cytochrome [Rhodospirillales bacterium]
MLATTGFLGHSIVLAAGLLIAALAIVHAQAADLALGEQVYKKCERCHTLNAGGAQAEGPNLHGIFGR